MNERNKQQLEWTERRDPENMAPRSADLSRVGDKDCVIPTCDAGTWKRARATGSAREHQSIRCNEAEQRDEGALHTGRWAAVGSALSVKMLLSVSMALHKLRSCVQAGSAHVSGKGHRKVMSVSTYLRI